MNLPGIVLINTHGVRPKQNLLVGLPDVLQRGFEIRRRVERLAVHPYLFRDLRVTPYITQGGEVGILDHTNLSESALDLSAHLARSDN